MTQDQYRRLARDLADDGADIETIMRAADDAEASDPAFNRDAFLYAVMKGRT